MSMSGKTLAHYEITSQLGKGCRDEVHQAMDQKQDPSSHRGMEQIAALVLPISQCCCVYNPQALIKVHKLTVARSYP
jgi:hypothetical protein